MSYKYPHNTVVGVFWVNKLDTILSSLASSVEFYIFVYILLKFCIGMI